MARTPRNHDLLSEIDLMAAPASTGVRTFAQQAQDGNKFAASAPEDAFWAYTEAQIDAARWNKAYPYQLLVLNADDGYSADGDWSFTLPIPPESMSISTPFAISTSITLGGVVEEHNGAPVRMMTFSGTTGVMPNRDTSASLNNIRNLQNEVFGIAAGTIQNASSALITAATTTGSAQWNLTPSEELDSGAVDSKGRGTGYYQFRLLQQFLERYVSLKKRSTKDARKKRLALAIWKDQAVYVVSPVSFEMRRSATDPLAYQYQMQFKAWRRVSLKPEGVQALASYQSRKNDPSALQSVLNTLSAARAALAGAVSSLEAVRGDVAQVMEIGRQSVLFVKDAIGAAVTVADMPSAIIQDAKGVVLDAVSISGLDPSVVDTAFDPASAFQADAAEVSNGQASSTSGALSKSASSSNSVFKDPVANHRLLDSIPLSQLSIRPETKRKIDAEVERVRRLTRLDFENMRDQLREVANDFADSIGAGSDTFNAAFGRPTVTSTKAPTDQDFDVLFALNSAIMELSRLAVAGAQDDTRLQAIEYVAGLARRSGIAFTTPVGKVAVPFPYGSTLEQLALRYLGDPKRWHEIAALNGLRSPYVDEEGFELPLLTNGRRNQVTLADSARLYVGQPVTLAASNTTKTKRRITKIDVVHQGMVIVHLDGDEDLERFTPMAGAFLHAFTPDTVNSNMQLYIPSATASTDQTLTSKSIPGLNDFTHLLEVGGVDLLLTQAGDLAVTPDGDCKLAVGLANLVQRVRIALSTPRGSLPQHPQYGLGLKAGVSTADLDARGILEAARGLFRDDPSFSGVLSASVQKAGVGARITMNVGVAGQDIVLPVSVDVRT